MIWSAALGSLTATLVASVAAPIGQAGAVSDAAGQVQAPQEPNAQAIPIDLEADEVVVPISDSVRAATWDWLRPGPATPMHVKLACLIYMPLGAPGVCIDAALLPKGARTVNWAALSAADRAAAASSSEDAKLVRTAVERRISMLRFKEDSVHPPAIRVRLFDEVVSPADARPMPPSAPLFEYGDVLLAKPLNGALLDTLYPPDAMRYQLRARAEVRCRVQPTLRLLCRDPGKVTLLPANVGSETRRLEESFRFATYQLVSTMELKPKSKDGRPVLGSDVRLAIKWELSIDP